MYLSQTDPGQRGALRSVPACVVVLGTVSLLTDVSAEMVTAYLPLYLVYTLQVSYVQLGLLDGFYTGATAVLRLVGGHLADRWGRPKAVATVGYGLSAVSRLGMLGVGASGLGIGAMLASDRAGKGLRTAPRDAMIAMAVPADRLGTAFGVHRTMDTAGALLGPVITFLLLVYVGTGPQPIFFVSFCFALLGLIVLAGFVRTPPRPRPTGSSRPSWRAMLVLLRRPPLRAAAFIAAVLGFATLSDAFVFLLLQKTTGIPLSSLPLLPLGTAAVFLLAAAPVGRLADRLGRTRVFIAGHFLLVGAYGVMAAHLPGYGAAAVVLGLQGLFYAATDGVLPAWVAQLVPESACASGMAVVQTAQALARFGSSVLAGVLMTVVTVDVTLGVATSALAIALVAAATYTKRPELVSREGES